MADCIFCKIINGEISSTKIYEDEKTFVMLDIAPASKNGGHCLVMPKDHAELITDLKEEDEKALMSTIKKISKALLKFGDGMNIIQNNKRIAGQFVMHVHFHLIPRFNNDGITIEKWAANKYSSKKEEEKIASKIKSLL